MRICHSSTAKVRAVDGGVLRALTSISEAHLREAAETISIPRHPWAESRNNRFVAGWLTRQLESCGYRTSCQGRYANVVALPSAGAQGPVVLIGAHYDEERPRAVLAGARPRADVDGYGRVQESALSPSDRHAGHAGLCVPATCHTVIIGPGVKVRVRASSGRPHPPTARAGTGRSIGGVSCSKQSRLP